jgi:hypothetical protein
MNWSRLAIAVIASGLVVSMTDWLFMGDLFAAIYKAEPQIWRQSREGFDERRAIIGGVLLGFVTCAAFILFSGHLGLRSYSQTLSAALAIWTIAPLPLIVTNALFMKFHPILAASHASGWLVKLCVAGLAAGWIAQ